MTGVIDKPIGLATQILGIFTGEPKVAVAVSGGNYIVILKASYTRNIQTTADENRTEREFYDYRDGTADIVLDILPSYSKYTAKKEVSERTGYPIHALIAYEIQPIISW